MTANLDFISLSIEKVIIHDLPKHYKKPKDAEIIEPKLSKKESNISHGMKAFFKEKIINALKSDKAFKVCYNPETDSPTGWVIGGLIDDEGVFVEKSHNMARHLFKVQNGQNSGGILVIILCKIKDANSCVIFKLDKEKGAQLQEDEETESFDIAEVQNLMLSDKTRIMKIAMLVKREDFNMNFDGLLVDYQSAIGNNKNLLSYFMHDFLGCQAFEDPKVTTRKFYNHTRTFVLQIEDPIKQAKYLVHLNSYIQSNESVLSPGEFADKYLEESEEKDQYKRFLEVKKFSFEAFPKDNILIKKELEKVSIDFENGVIIITKKKSLEDSVSLVKMEDGRHKATVTSKIKKVS